MILYLLYKLAYFLANHLSLENAYRTACFIADVKYYLSRKDRNAVMRNLRTIVDGSCDDKELKKMAKELHRNFAKYLVDFFRFSRVNDEYLKNFVKIDGLDNIDKGLAAGKGVILLSAHIGNWELGGLVVSLLRHPMKAVVLPHKNEKINEFFTRQRSIGNLRPVEIGISLKSCYTILKNNGLLALLGDRDFSKNGFYINFFKRRTLIPKGPAVFSYRLGSCIVPSFMIRERDDTFRLIFEPPIFPDTSIEEEPSVKTLAVKYSSVIESYVRRYPSQWYMFRDVWNEHEKSLQPDTII